MNILVASDDFGTGYSSLSLLKRLPIDMIKIDREFVADRFAEPAQIAIAETIIAFGTRAGIETLAEGRRAL